MLTLFKPQKQKHIHVKLTKTLDQLAAELSKIFKIHDYREKRDELGAFVIDYDRYYWADDLIQQAQNELEIIRKFLRNKPDTGLQFEFEDDLELNASVMSGASR